MPTPTTAVREEIAMRRTSLNRRRDNDVTRKDDSSSEEILILVYKDLELISKYVFSDTRITIGKSKSADVLLSDPRISDIHAIVHLQNENLIISDQTERMGVYLNGKPVKAAVLESFDLIDIGDYSLKFKIVKNHKAQVRMMRRSAEAQTPSEDTGRIAGLMEQQKQPPKRKQTPAQIPKTQERRVKSAPPEDFPEYPDDFFTLPPYQPLDPEEEAEGRAKKQMKDIDLIPEFSPEETVRCYNLVFTGKLKPGWSLIRVKDNLTRELGIDFRKLSGLVKGRRAVVYRNIDYARAVKLEESFNASGALCIVVPGEERPKRPSRRMF